MSWMLFLGRGPFIGQIYSENDRSKIGEESAPRQMGSAWQTSDTGQDWYVNSSCATVAQARQVGLKGAPVTGVVGSGLALLQVPEKGTWFMSPEMKCT